MLPLQGPPPVNAGVLPHLTGNLANRKVEIRTIAGRGQTAAVTQLQRPRNGKESKAVFMAARLTSSRRELCSMTHDMLSETKAAGSYRASGGLSSSLTRAYASCTEPPQRARGWPDVHVS